MSISKRFMAPDKWYRSFFILIILIIAFFILFSIRCFANEVQDHNVVFTKSIYHRHTGSSGGGGGCYSVRRTGTREQNCEGGGQCSSGPHGPDTSGKVYYVGACDKCGARVARYGSSGYVHCDRMITASFTYYDLGCNQSPSDLLGVLSVEQDTAEWAKEVVLTASYEAIGNIVIAEAPYIWNGEEATSQNSYTVSGNGDYTLRLNADENADTENGVVVIPIRNIDTTPPIIASHVMEPEDGWIKEGVLLTLGEVADLQPDNTPGCGLHMEAYSYDNGETWTADNSYFYKDSGRYTVLVRDNLENVSSYEVSLFNVDNQPPTIESVEYDNTPNVLSTSLSVTASDIQPDGSEGSGLHELPYSFDGGNTWTDSPILETDRNGVIVIAVRDVLGNISYQEVVITNIDGCGPRVSYYMEPNSWTSTAVWLYLMAQDINADGSAGIGLPDAWYSLDGGNTWTNEEELMYTENREISVIARDNYGNRTYLDISVNCIDKDGPLVYLEMEVTGEGENQVVRLLADGKDGGSGLHEQAYSWDNGACYGTNKVISVTENGSYEVVVRDKVGNCSRKQIEVDIFPEPIEEIIPVIEVVAPTKEEETIACEEDEIEEETECEPVTMKATPKAEATIIKPILVTEEEEWGIEDTLAIIVAVAAGCGILFVLIYCLEHSIAVYAEGEREKMQYTGRQWIHHRDERYEVRFTEKWLEKCVTTHFCLRPSLLFRVKRKGLEVCCLFPEDICITLPIQKEMDFSLL